MKNLIVIALKYLLPIIILILKNLAGKLETWLNNKLNIKPTFKFGKKAPKLDYRTLKLEKYLKKDVAPPLPSFSNLQKVYTNLNVNDPTILFPMDGNDQYGDCTCAAVAHLITINQALINNNVIPKTKDVLKLYRKLTDGQDTGCNELDVLNYWKNHKFVSDEIIAYVSIDPKNHAHVQKIAS